MNDFIWQSRPLILFAPTEGHALVARQSEALHGHLDALRERDTVVITVVGQTTSVDGVTTPQLMADALRRRYGVAVGEAAALLVGKDGGVKLRQPHAFKASTLFETIDAMPMRRQEMKSRGQYSE